MTSIPHARLLNSNQVLIRKMLVEKKPLDQTRPLLLQQHAQLHTHAMSEYGDWSYQDEVLADLPQAWMRIIPKGEDHSVAWLLWHLTRCEDITMNMLILRGDQLLHSEGWLKRLEIDWRDTGNAMTFQEIVDFSQDINLMALFDYRLCVGIGTQNIIKQLAQEDLYRKVNPEDIQRLFDQGAVVEEARGVAEYWSKRDVAGLLLMPATRHILSHLNEARRILKKVKKAKAK
jgi:hypothetical protein